MSSSLYQNYASRPKRGWHFHLLARGATNAKLAKRADELGDIPWERFINLEAFPGIQFYDYTKIAKRLGRTPKHYYLTFSLSESNEPEASQALAEGFNVAAPPREAYPIPGLSRDRWRHA